MPVLTPERPSSISSSFDRFSYIEEPQSIQITEGLGANSILLHTGFNIRGESRRLFRDYNTYIDQGLGRGEAWAKTVGELDLQLRNFILEYVQTSTVLPHKHRVGEFNGRERQLGNNGFPIVDGITREERKGSVLEASEQVEEAALRRVKGLTKVINSPVGPTGLTSENGKPITYFNNQSMIFWTNEGGNSVGLTLVTDLDEDQSRQLSVDLGVEKDKLREGDALDRVSNIVKNPATLSFPDLRTNPAEYVLDKIVAIRGSSPFRLVQADGSVEIRTIEQTRQDIKRMTQLLNFNDDTERYLAELKTFVLSKEDSLDSSAVQFEIVKKMEEAILKATMNYLINNKPEVLKVNFSAQGGSIRFDNPIQVVDQIESVIAFLQSRGGCNGGGPNVLTTLRGLGIGSDYNLSGSSLEQDQYGSLEFKCPKCNSTNKRPHGQLVDMCQHCMSDIKC